MTEPEKQQQFKLAQAIDSGEDENGVYDMVPLSMVKGGQLKPFKVYRKPIKHIINASSPAPRGWYKAKHEPNRVRPRPCYTEALLTTPYGGYCHVGCAFCYVDHGTRGYRATGIATGNPDYPDYMERQLKQLKVCGAAYISSFTEPFQLLENQYHNTQRLSGILAAEGLPLFYLSRKIPPEWAINSLLQNPYSYMQWSVNTSRTDVYKKLSPGSYTIEDWLNTVAHYRMMGIYISVQVNPVLPGIVTLEDLQTLISLGAQAGVRHFIFKFAEQVFNNRKMLIDRLASRKLEGVDKFDAVLTQKIGGVYTVDQDVRLEWLNSLLSITREAGVTMSTCYEYYADGHAGSNLAPYFTTSDQCHGRGIPIFYRPEAGAKFQPLPGCYRKGCLYCEEYGTKACNNNTLILAKALQATDMKSISLEGDPKNWKLAGSCIRPDKVRYSPACNPGMRTDAELWGWDQ